MTAAYICHTFSFLKKWQIGSNDSKTQFSLSDQNDLGSPMSPVSIGGTVMQFYLRLGYELRAIDKISLITYKTTSNIILLDKN